MTVKRVAIACQGGGTHAAFTWGVLTRILETKKTWNESSGDGRRFDIVALSGTSAGALCALATWYGLVPNTADGDCGSVEKAVERLDFLWTTFAASSVVEQGHNALVAALLHLKETGLPFPGVNPYHLSTNAALSTLSVLGARAEYLGFQPLLSALCPHFDAVDWPAIQKADLRILVSAIEIVSGNFEVFDSDQTLEDREIAFAAGRDADNEPARWRMRRPFSLAGVAASGTLPDLLPAQEISDMEFPTCEPGVTTTRSGLYWDGLYSQNPPVRDFLDVSPIERKPDEIWVIRINAQEARPRNATVGLEDIRDRENELAGNLSLNQELDHILTMNRWISRFGTDHPALKGRKVVRVRTIKMTRETAWRLRRTSKFDRSPDHLARLREEGRQVAEEWLASWRRGDDAVGSYPDDARYPRAAGGPDRLPSE